MRTLPRLVDRVLLTCLVLAFVGAGCSGGSSDESDEDRSEEEAAELASPLEAFFGMETGRLPESERTQNRELFERREQLMAECMRAKGFDYVARGFESDDGPAGAAAALPAEEFVQRYGFGLFTMEQADDSEAVDPNAAVVAAMSPAEQTAYEEALAGEDGSAGCRGEADEDVFGGTDDLNLDDGGMGWLWKESDQLRQRVVDDPRVVEAKQAWAECMADRGQSGMESPEDAMTKVIEHYEELRSGGEGLASPTEPGSLGDARSSIGRHLDLSGLSAEDLTELRSFELTVAAADLDCREHYDPVHRAVTVDVENEFIDQNRAELERLRDAMGVKGET